MIFSVTQEFSRFLVFALIGLFNTLFDTILWRFFVWRLEKYPATISYIHKNFKLNQYAFAQVISFALSATSSYFLNKFFTFSDASKTSDFTQIFRFFSVTFLSLGISVLIINLLTETNWILKFTHKISFVDKHWPIIAKLLTVGVTMIVNFVGYRLFVF